jgi:hypothetical protein
MKLTLQQLEAHLWGAANILGVLLFRDSIAPSSTTALSTRSSPRSTQASPTSIA